MQLFKKLYHWILKNLPDVYAVQFMYFRNFGHFANLKNPKTFNEKVAWRKLYQHDPRFTLYADKVAVKDEVAKIIGPQYVIPTLWSGERPEDIPFDTLSCPYVIKTNNGFGDIIFVKSQDNLDKKAIIRHFNNQKGDPHFIITREWGYKDIPRKIIVEKMLDVSNDLGLLDYKFFVFDGKVHYIQVNVRIDNEVKLRYYDPSWSKLPVKLGKYPDAEDILKPDTLQEMLGLAEKLGAEFDFVRVDFYSLDQGVFFGEVTFTPNGGLVPFHPHKIWDYKLGEPWKIDAA